MGQDYSWPPWLAAILQATRKSGIITADA